MCVYQSKRTGAREKQLHWSISQQRSHKVSIPTQDRLRLHVLAVLHKTMKLTAECNEMKQCATLQVQQ